MGYDLKEIEELQKLLQERKDKLIKKKIPIPSPPLPKKELPVFKDTEHTLKSKIKQFSLKFYIVAVLIPIFLIILFIILYLNKISSIILLLYVVLLFPVFIASVIVIAIKLYLNRTRIKTPLYKKFSKNFVIAIFFMKNKRIKELAFKIDKSSNSFNYGKATYIIDHECVYQDMDNHPIIYYFEGIPNPLKFNFMKYLTMYTQAMVTGEPVTDYEGKVLDISYSSETLQLYKKDKLFQELHTSTKAMDKYILYMLIAFGLFVVAIVLVVIFLQKG